MTYSDTVSTGVTGCKSGKPIAMALIVGGHGDIGPPHPRRGLLYCKITSADGLSRTELNEPKYRALKQNWSFLAM